MHLNQIIHQQKHFFYYKRSDKWSWNWLKSWYRTSDNRNFGGKNELNKILDFFSVGIVTSVSARKLKCLSSARLEPENSSSGSSLVIIYYRAVARSENPGGHVVLGGNNVPPPLVEIGLADLPKSVWGGGTAPPRPPRMRRACIR